MKKLQFALFIGLGLLLGSCSGAKNAEANAEGFGQIEKEMKSKFGDNAYYTQINISYDKRMGNMISTTVTDAPESLGMGEWTNLQGVWNQTSEVTIELPEGTKATDFMFQLGDKISLTKMGELVEESMKSLTKEKGIENPVLDGAYIKYPDNGDISKAQYSIMLEPENGGTTFSYYYNLDGSFDRMNY